MEYSIVIGSRSYVQVLVLFANQTNTECLSIAHNNDFTPFDRGDLRALKNFWRDLVVGVYGRA